MTEYAGNDWLQIGTFWLIIGWIIVQAIVKWRKKRPHEGEVRQASKVHRIKQP